MQTNTRPTHSYTICLIAGESSGDMIGGKLMASLKGLSSKPIQFIGIGGENMRNEGLQSLFPISELSIMGISEIVPYIPKLLKRIKYTSEEIKTMNPQAVVTIDSPGFSLRVANKLKHTDIQLIHYVAPSVWAWKSWRAKNMSKYFNRILTLFEFETSYFEAAGLKSVFVGHPIIESGAANGDGAAFRSRNGIPLNAKLICILPGSRLTEIKKHLPIIEDSLKLLSNILPDFWLVLPLVNHVAAETKAVVKNWPFSVILIEGANVENKYDAFAASDAAIACSGTVALELALANTPYVTIYKMSWLSTIVAKIFVKVPYVNIINILLDKEVIPELLLENCKPNLILLELKTILNDTDSQTRQRKNFLKALDMVAIHDQLPSERAAKAILETIVST